MMRTILLGAIVVTAANSLIHAANVTVQNLNNAGDNGYGLFNETGSLLPETLDGNIRVGFFNLTDTQINDAWAAGDLATLDSSFQDFGLAGMTAFGDGLFQDQVSSAISDGSTFDGKNITLFASNGTSFTDANAEFLIYRFDTVYGDDDGGLFDVTVILGETSGNLFVGQNGIYSNDFGGGTALPGFNTVSAVPEPSTYAALAGFCALGWVMLRRRRG